MMRFRNADTRQTIFQMQREEIASSLVERIRQTKSRDTRTSRPRHRRGRIAKVFGAGLDLVYVPNGHRLVKIRGLVRLVRC
jgi:hypothetical protein